MRFLVIAVLTALVSVSVLSAEEPHLAQSDNLLRIDPGFMFSSEAERAEFTKRLAEIQDSDVVCRKEVTYEHSSVHEGAEGLQRLSGHGLAVIARLYRQYQEDDAFVRHIGALLTLDLEDVDNELIIANEKGGLGILFDGGIEILPIISRGQLMLSNYTRRPGLSVTILASGRNYGYHAPVWATEQIPHVFEYHFHAVRRRDQQKLCAPSFGVDQFKGGLTGDIAHALWEIEEFGQAHQFLFIALPNRSFGTIYYGGTRAEDGSATISVVALPIQHY